MSGAAQIVDEREKQIEKWGLKHDIAEHPDGGLLAAAIVLLTEADDFKGPQWLWDLVAKTKKDPKRRLVIAGAFIAAELDRLEAEGKL